PDTRIKINAARDLTKSEIKRLALADPAGVPAGIYAKAYLEKQNLWPAVAPKIVPTENVRAALAAVEAGNVEAAIVYKTDAAISKKISIAFVVPAADSPAIHYPVALLKDSKDTHSANNLKEYLLGPAATPLFTNVEFAT